MPLRVNKGEQVNVLLSTAADSEAASLIKCETSQPIIPADLSGDLSGVAEGEAGSSKSEDGSETESRDPEKPGFPRIGVRGRLIKPGMTYR